MRRTVCRQWVRTEERFGSDSFNVADLCPDPFPRMRCVSRGLLVGLLLLTGCLPYSCRPTATEALFPSDSLSRRIAQGVPADTLQRRWTVTGSRTHSLSYPRTVRFTPDGGLAVSDVERNSLFEIGSDGTIEEEIRSDSFAVPYLAGVRCDTLVVFNAGTDRFDFVVEKRRLAGRAVAVERPGPETLVYALATDRSLYLKVTGEEVRPQILRFSAAGRAVARASLPEPYWRRAGGLRAWTDRLVSVSGFRPVVHTLPRPFRDGARPDSLSLVGFDSPMLERSYAYARGDVSKPPLMAASAAAVGDRLFVLNLRPGWVQIDAYDRDGGLQRRLIERHDVANRDFYPLDLDARRAADGYDFAVTIRSPDPQLRLFHWSAGTGSSSASPAAD